MRALISVSNKNGLVKFAKKLVNQGFEIYATEGTARFLEKNGIPAKKLSEITGMKESEYIKTLHPEIFKRIFDGFFDLIVVNLYEDKIDVGGVALIRAGVKANLPVICYVDDYKLFLDAIKERKDLRKMLHRRAFEYLIENDRKILENIIL